MTAQQLGSQPADQLTKREYFAALALAGLVADKKVEDIPKHHAMAAVAYADALLARLAPATAASKTALRSGSSPDEEQP